MRRVSMVTPPAALSNPCTTPSSPLEEEGDGHRCVAAESLLRPLAPEDLRPAPLPGKRKPGSDSEILRETRPPSGGAGNRSGAMAPSPVTGRG